MTNRFILPALTLLAACGGEGSSATDRVAAQPTGGAGGSAGAGTGGTSSGGGAPVTCSAPKLELGPVGINPGPDTRAEEFPQLVKTGTTAAFAYRWTSLPGGTVTGIRSFGLDAWGPWPKAFGPSNGTNYDMALGGPIVAVPATDGLLAVLRTNQSFAPGGGKWEMILERELNPATGAGSLLAVGEAPLPTTLRPASLTTVPGGIASSFEAASTVSPVLTTYALKGKTVKGTTTEETHLAETACGTSPLHADARTVGTAVVSAHSTSRLCCPCDDGVDGPPTKLLAGPWDAVATVAQLVPTAFPDAVINMVRLLPKTGELSWLVVGRDTAASATALEVGVVDAMGKLVTPMVVLPTALWPTAPVEVAAFDGGLLFASFVNGTANVGSLKLSVVQGDPQAGFVHTESLVSTTFPWAPTKPSLLVESAVGASPRLVVAFSHPEKQDPSFYTFTHFYRFALSCE